MIRLIFCLSFFTLLASCGHSQPAPPPMITPGAEQPALYLPLLKDKRVALVVNQTALAGNTHLVDTLLALGVHIKKVFAAEHGFRGNKSDGALIEDGRDSDTGLPIVSLYGKTKKPTAEMLSDVDLVIFDMQDVGVRCFTFISTMHYVMEGCAENNKAFMVLDRPNPNGMYVDGPVLDPAYRSFVGMHPIPLVHGLTVGELAMMINGEGWLENGVACKLTVIPVAHYHHKDRYTLPVKPSPNLPNDKAICLYPSLTLFEGTDISVGRGTYAAFSQIGHPSLTHLPHQFTPKSIPGMSITPPHQDIPCYGYDLSETDFTPHLTLEYLLEFYQKFEAKDTFFKTDFFNKLAGNGTLIEQIKAGKTEAEISASWQPELEAYKKTRKKYLLYPDL